MIFDIFLIYLLNYKYCINFCENLMELFLIVYLLHRGPRREGNQGLGVQNSATPEECDNEYDAYRKRMMLAYRFRPNPLVNKCFD